MFSDQNGIKQGISARKKTKIHTVKITTYF